MSSADQSELHQDPTFNLAASRANGVQIPGSDILSPLASRSLFWRARYLEASPALCHIPLLFWLTEAARPRIAVTLGVTDAVPHFALCQAVEKLGLESLCIGIEPASEADAQPADLSKQRAFNEINFAEFSQILQAAPGKDGFIPPESKIDLLLINRPITQQLLDTLDTHWLPQLSERSLIVVLHDEDTAEDGSLFRHLSAAGNSFTCDLDSRASVIFHGPEQNDRLQRLAGLKPGLPGYLAVRNIFARLGELHSNAERLAGETSNTDIARRKQDEQAAALATAQTEASDLGQTVTQLEQALQELRAKYQQDTDQLNTLQDSFSAAQATCTDLQELVSEQKNTLAERYKDIAILGNELQAKDEEIQAVTGDRDSLHQEKDLLSAELGALKTTLSAAETERQKLQQLTSEQEDSLAERYKDIAVLGNELQAKIEETQTVSEERDALRQEIEALKRQLGEVEQQRDMHAERVQALEHSTSWRVTAPLRKVSLAVKPQ